MNEYARALLFLYLWILDVYSLAEVAPTPIIHLMPPKPITIYSIPTTYGSNIFQYINNIGMMVSSWLLSCID